MPTTKNAPEKRADVVATNLSHSSNVIKGTELYTFPTSDKKTTYENNAPVTVIGVFMKTSDTVPEYWLKVRVIENGLCLYVKPEALPDFDIDEYTYDDQWIYMFHEDTIVGDRQISRISTGIGGYKNHIGIDFSGYDSQTFKTYEYPVFSPIAGEVIISYNYDDNHYDTTLSNMGAKGDSRDFGNAVTIKTQNGFTIRLMHLEFNPLVSDGEKTTPPTMLGMVGNTGLSGGYHLHMEIRQFESKIDDQGNFKYKIIDGNKKEKWVLWSEFDLNHLGQGKLKNPLFYFKNEVEFKKQSDNSKWDGNLNEDPK